MKLLMITARVDPDHPILGFVCGWIRELSKQVEHLDVITFGKGEIELPENVAVHTTGRTSSLKKFWAFNRLLKKLTPQSDAIFAHMYPIFQITAYPWAKIYKKPTIMWYAHGRTDMKMRIAAKMADKLVTPSQESANIETPKKIVVGHGIDTDKFSRLDSVKGKFTIASVGRISPIKRCEDIIAAIKTMPAEKQKSIEVKFAGPVYNKKYRDELEDLAKSGIAKNSISFLGSTPYSEIEKIYQGASITINSSQTNSIDKSVLESMACGVPALTSNKAFLEIFDEELRKKCFFNKGDRDDLARKIGYFMENEDPGFRSDIRSIVVERHSLRNLSIKLSAIIEKEVNSRKGGTT